MYLCHVYDVMQSQTAVTDYLKSKQLLLFGFALQYYKDVYDTQGGYIPANKRHSAYFYWFTADPQSATRAQH